MFSVPDPPHREVPQKTMKMVSLQKVLSEKLSRQSRIKELQVHASGHCVHLGKLSPGCHNCFVPDKFSFNINAGTQCNSGCPYCFGKETNTELSAEAIKDILRKMCADVLRENLDKETPRLAFSGVGEPLRYLDTIREFMKDFSSSILPDMKRKPWTFAYTNGLLASRDVLEELRACGFDEIRFHLGASNFAEGVYVNMKSACEIIPVVSVETPSWPPHRSQLFEMLPQLDEMGVKHLNLGEVQVTAHNLECISKALPEGRTYQFRDIHLYDEGLVYDIMEAVIEKGYSFSVLDCNSLVKDIQRSSGKRIMHDPVDGLCANMPQHS